MKGTLEDLRKIVFEKKKCPYYNRRHGKLTISTILSSEGLHTYMYSPDMKFTKILKPWEEITEEDVSLLLENLPNFDC